MVVLYIASDEKIAFNSLDCSLKNVTFLFRNAYDILYFFYFVYFLKLN